jgi:hypothetical protein
LAIPLVSLFGALLLGRRGQAWQRLRVSAWY